MANMFRRITKVFIASINIIVALLFLLACFVPNLNPTQWWFLSFLGLVFPFLLLCLVGFFIFLVFLKPKLTLISLLAIIIGWKSVSMFFGFNLMHQFKTEKDSHVLRVASWNVARFIELKKNNNKGSQTRLKMMELLKEQNADILCLQEFHTSINPEYYNNINYIKKELNYPYFYFSYDEDGGDHYFSSIIFSRFPIIDTGKIYYPKPTLPDVLLHADIKLGNDTIRIYTTHLQSVQFRKADYDKIEKIKNQDDNLIGNTRSIFSKIKRASSYRSIQANIVKKEINESPYPFLISGDFNDVPNSYTYFTIKENLKDAFLEKGFGIGRTYSALSPTLRIDYILASNSFSVKQFKRLVRDYSDHYLLVADFDLAPIP